MNVRGATLATCVLIGFAFTLTQAYLYTITVRTGNGFQPTDGSLYIVLRSSNQANNVSLGGLTRIVPNWSYIYRADSPIPAPQLSSAVFEWVNRQSKFGSITLKNVTVVPSYIQDPKLQSQYTKNFCAMGFIQNGHSRTMIRC